MGAVEATRCADDFPERNRVGRRSVDYGIAK